MSLKSLKKLTTLWLDFFFFMTKITFYTRIINKFSYKDITVVISNLLNNLRQSLFNLFPE